MHASRLCRAVQHSGANGARLTLASPRDFRRPLRFPPLRAPFPRGITAAAAGTRLGKWRSCRGAARAAARRRAPCGGSARRAAPPARRHPARAAPRTRVCRAHRVVARRSRMPLHMPPALQPQTAQQAAEISDALCRAASMRRENAAGYRTACAGARRPAACAPPERTRARRESQRQSGITACRGFVIDASLRPLPCPLAAPPSPPWPRKVRGKGRGMQSRPCPVPASCRTAGTLARAAASRARKLLRAANAVSQQ
jgi:hypothetical protein